VKRVLLLTVVVIGCGEPAAAPAQPAATAPAMTAAPGGQSGVDDCAPHGTCVAVAECSPAKGHLVHGHGCGAAHLACCSVGEDSCGGKEGWVCCRDGQESRPLCKDGSLTCLEGAVTGAPGGCKK